MENPMTIRVRSLPRNSNVGGGLCSISWRYKDGVYAGIDMEHVRRGPRLPSKIALEGRV